MGAPARNLSGQVFGHVVAGTVLITKQISLPKNILKKRKKRLTKKVRVVGLRVSKENTFEKHGKKARYG